MEAPGLDFGGFWGRCFEFVICFWLRFLEMVVHRHNAKIAKKAENAENAGTAKNLPKQELDHRRAKSGWAAVHPPRGGFNPPPTEGGAKRARSIATSLKN